MSTPRRSRIQSLVLYLPFALVVCLYLGFTLYQVQNAVYNGSRFAMALPLLALLLAAAVGLMALHVHHPKLALGLMLLTALGVRLYLVLTLPTAPMSDFKAMFQAGMQTASGSLEWTHQASSGNYFYRWGYQIPFALYEGLLLSIVPDMLVIKLADVLWMTLTALMIYRIASRFTPSPMALGAAFLYAVDPSCIYLVNMLSNQPLSTFLLLWGLDTLLRAKRPAGFLASGLLLALHQLIRPEGIIALLSIGACALYRIILCPRRAFILKALRNVLLVAACYVLVTAGAEQLLIATDVAPSGIGNRRPEHRFAIGLNFSSHHGEYNSDASYIYRIEDEAERKAELRRFILEGFESCDKPLSFFLRKISAYWTDGSPYYWLYHDMESPGLPFGLDTFDFYALLTTLELCLRALVYGFTLLCLLYRLWHRQAKALSQNPALLLCMAVIGCVFCAFLVLEVQPKYRYFVIPFVYCLLALLAPCKLQKSPH